MAVLSDRDRGQLLLVGAVVIGFVIVTLSLTLNGGLYAETIADRAVNDVSNTETRYLLADIRSDGAFILARAISTQPNLASQETYVTDSVQTLNEEYREYYARSDAVVDVGVGAIESGTRFAQSSPGPLDTGTPVVVTDGRVRNVTLTVTDDGPDSGTTELVFENDDGSSYAVEMDSTGRVAVDRDGTTVECTSGTDTSTPYSVNVSAATVDGEPCPALEFGSELDDAYDVELVNGGAVDGTYSIVTNTNGGPEQVIYAVDIDVTHRTTTADYEGTIRVAPEEI